METTKSVPTKALRMTATFSYTDRFGNEYEWRPGDLIILGPKNRTWVLLKSGLSVRGAQGKGKHVLVPHHNFVVEDYTLQIPTIAVQSSSAA